MLVTFALKENKKIRVEKNSKQRGGQWKSIPYLQHMEEYTGQAIHYSEWSMILEQ